MASRTSGADRDSSQAGEFRGRREMTTHMTNRVSWPQICRSAEFKGLWVALDNCRYDQSSMQPVEGDVVDTDPDLADLCGRLREAQRGSCAIVFCEGEVIGWLRGSVTPPGRQARTSAVPASFHGGRARRPAHFRTTGFP